MAEDKPEEKKKGMTVSEAGRLGGQRTRDLYQGHNSRISKHGNKIFREMVAKGKEKERMEEERKRQLAEKDVVI